MKTILEICCGSLQAVEAAVSGGADRIELCSGLAEGGMTPSSGLVRAAADAAVAVNVLIRPRPGDFLYGAGEVRLMCDDVEEVLECGAHGVAIGALTECGDLDHRTLERMMACARRVDAGCDFTLHRAFDLTRDPLSALRQAADMGFDRVLTSGCAASAMEGRELLAVLHGEAMRLGIHIMAGGGVNAANAAALGEVADELHASARRPLGSDMIWRRKGVVMGLPGDDEYSRLETDSEEVKAILQSLKR